MEDPQADRMYRDRAELYDLIYADKPYGEEARRVRELLEAEGVDPGAAVLEAACGTGRYLEHLRRWYDVAGFDLYEPVLEIARRRLEDVALFQADMAELEFDEPVDALLCLFASIGYLKTDARLARTARRFYEAVRPGGVVVVEPWLFPEEFVEGHPSLHTYESEDLVISRQSVSRRRGDVSVLDLHRLVARRDGGVEHFTETHELRMYTVEELLNAFSQAGFAARFEPQAHHTDVIIARRLEL